ncbi:hypothetical protein [Hymenobacter sp.]|uniref:hypothetical protein n=1 Tax=Hymenobacter sp. TaxID=1898978 RepID=UPI00286A2D65|nr:hypothetical protein [Hymenobacter sp.]
MKKQLARFLILSLLALGAFSCKKEYDDNSLSPLQDSVADVPVTVPNQEFFERFPIVTASVKNTPGAGVVGPFTIVLEIPAGKGIIREITKITTGTAGLANLQGADALSFNYDAAGTRLVPIAGNGTNQITFASSLDRYTAYRARVGPGAAGQPAVVAPNASFTPQNPNQLPYYFLLTLEDGRQLVSTAVRVRVVE